MGGTAEAERTAVTGLKLLSRVVAVIDTQDIPAQSPQRMAALRGFSDSAVCRQAGFHREVT